MWGAYVSACEQQTLTRRLNFSVRGPRWERSFRQFKMPCASGVLDLEVILRFNGSRTDASPAGGLTSWAIKHENTPLRDQGHRISGF